MPVFKGDDLVLCDVAGVSAFDVGQLVYFGMSIFWRAAVHKWATTTGLIAPKVDLGALEGPTRKFRRCEGPVPEDGIVLTADAWPYKRAHQVLYPAVASHLQECQRYWFHIPGLFFSLYLGGNIPADVRRRNAAKGIIGLDLKAADSVIEFTKQGVLSKMGPKMEALNQEIAVIRSKTTQ